MPSKPNKSKKSTTTSSSSSSTTSTSVDASTQTDKVRILPWDSSCTEKDMPLYNSLSTSSNFKSSGSSSKATANTTSSESVTVPTSRTIPINNYEDSSELEQTLERDNLNPEGSNSNDNNDGDTSPKTGGVLSANAKKKLQKRNAEKKRKEKEREEKEKAAAVNEVSNTSNGANSNSKPKKRTIEQFKKEKEMMMMMNNADGNSSTNDRMMNANGNLGTTVSPISEDSSSVTVPNHTNDPQECLDLIKQRETQLWVQNVQSLLSRAGGDGSVGRKGKGGPSSGGPLGPLGPLSGGPLSGGGPLGPLGPLAGSGPLGGGGPLGQGPLGSGLGGVGGPSMNLNQSSESNTNSPEEIQEDVIDKENAGPPPSANFKNLLQSKNQVLGEITDPVKAPLQVVTGEESATVSAE